MNSNNLMIIQTEKASELK